MIGMTGSRGEMQMLKAMQMLLKTIEDTNDVPVPAGIPTWLLDRARDWEDGGDSSHLASLGPSTAPVPGRTGNSSTSARSEIVSTSGERGSERLLGTAS